MSTTDRVYDYIVAFRACHQVSPTVREVAAGVGLSSTSAVAHHLTKLMEEGRLKRTVPGRPTRSYVPVEVRHG